MSRLIFIGLWNIADDHGWLEDDPERLRMLIMPNEALENFEPFLDVLIMSGRIERHQIGEGTALRIANWEKHQRVDRPSQSKIAREDSRKLPIPAAERREVALKYGCKPGQRIAAKCHYCGFEGLIVWHTLYSGRPSFWVSFCNLELDHFVPESKGGQGVAENLVLACRFCNRSKQALAGAEFIASPREPSRDVAQEGKGRERKGKEEAPQRPAQRDLSFDPVAVWCEEYKHEYRKNPAIDKKDAGIAHNLARLVVTEPKFRGMCKAFFADKNQRVVNAGHPISWMYTGKNRYLLDAANTPEQDIGENPERT
jgi:5-methylcytosine-specific restriction endonuclease McrA